MTALVFWALAGLLLAAAVVLVAIPLCRRGPEAGPGQAEYNIAAYRRQLQELEQEHADGIIDTRAYQQARAELERRLLEDVGPATAEAPAQTRPAADGAAGGRRLPWAALVVAVSLPALTAVVYHQAGTSPAYIQALRDDPERLTELGIRTAIEGLEQQLERDPLNDVAWHMLGRGHARSGDLDRAAEALTRAWELRGDDPGLLTELAQVHAMRQPGQSLQGEPRRLLERALAADPDHAEALWLAGMAAAEAGDMERTVDHWQRLLALDDGGLEAEQLRHAMAALRERLAREQDEAGAEQPPPTVPERDAAAGADGGGSDP